MKTKEYQDDENPKKFNKNSSIPRKYEPMNTEQSNDNSNVRFAKRRDTSPDDTYQTKMIEMTNQTESAILNFDQDNSRR